MNELRLDGSYARLEAVGEPDYYVFQMDAVNLRKLAMLLKANCDLHEKLRVRIGTGNISLIKAAFGCSETLSSADHVLIQVSSHDIIQLSLRLDQVAESKAEPDYLAHVHLDTYFTTPPQGLSDIVFQKIDDYHP